MPDQTDTRREDVARAIHDGPNAQAQYVAAGIRPHGFDDCSWREQYLADADAALAVLPAPPVVDEASIRERIARQLEAEQQRARAAHQAANVDHFAHDYCRWVGHAEALGNAARIARGATR